MHIGTYARMNDWQLKVSYRLTELEKRMQVSEMLPKIIEFLTYETEFVLFSAVLENFVLPAG